MRIIRGRFKTRRYGIPKNFPSRPTTDFAKEGLFNILENRHYLEDLKILDLCSGSGNIAMEFLSREAGSVVAVDKNYNCVKHIRKMAFEFNCENEIQIIQSEILKYLENCTQKFDLVFADPPYAFSEYDKIIDKVFEKELLLENGELIIEHGKENNFENRTQFDFSRKYGNVHFTFFKNQ